MQASKLVVSVLVFLLWASCAHAESFYARPASDCPINGNGTSQACATTANGPGAWNGVGKPQYSATDQAGKVDAGDTLFVCGHHKVVTVQDRMYIPVDGTAEEPILFDFNCPNNPGTLDGGKTQVRLIWVKDNGKYLTFNAPVVYDSGPNEYPVSFYGSATAERFITVKNGRFLDNGLGLSTIFAWGSDWNFDGNYFDGTGDDAVHVQGGKNLRFVKNTCRHLSLNTAGGDCLQRHPGIATDTGYTIVNDNDVEKDVDWKYGLLVGDVTGYTEVQRNWVKCLAGPSTNPSGCSPIYVGGNPNIPPENQTQEIIVRGNRTWGGWRGLTVAFAKNATKPAIVQANITEYAGTLGLWLWNSTHVTSTFNIFAHNGQYGAYGDQAVSTTPFTNNIFYRNAKGLFSNHGPSGSSLSNDYFGQTSWDIHVGSAQGTLDCSDKTVDPLFVGVSDYRLQPLSPLRWAGRPGICTDFRGRPCATPPFPPAMGAYQ